MGIDRPAVQPRERYAIVAGFGPVGRFVADGLEGAGFTVMVVDTNASSIHKRVALGKPGLCGDIREESVLREAGLMRARVLALTIPDQRQTVEACRVAHRLHPSVEVFARTNHVSQGMVASAVGADHVVVEELVTAEAMRQLVLSRAM